MTPKPSNDKTVATAVLGGGCFWCTEAVYKRVKGILHVEPGYSGGWLENPSYEDVKTGQTGHAEVIKITFNPAEISFDEILDIFFSTHDPTQAHRQGADTGSQYRSVIFWQNEAQLETAKNKILKLNQSGTFDKPVVTSLEIFTRFWPAEDYHRNYFENHPENPYCQVVIQPKLKKFERLWNKYLKE